jgi:hypothetical protein
MIIFIEEQNMQQVLQSQPIIFFPGTYLLGPWINENKPALIYLLDVKSVISIPFSQKHAEFTKGV